jgi:hypothetical protein
LEGWNGIADTLTPDEEGVRGAIAGEAAVGFGGRNAGEVACGGIGSAKGWNPAP